MNATRLISGHDKDLGGGFKVLRLLPALGQRSVGPFIFMDHFGPATSHGDPAHDVRPHPHIGLSTVSYLFEGGLLHHDSTGARQEIRPGDINWMTAGRGIVHSERPNTSGAVPTPCTGCNCGAPCRCTRKTAPPPSSMWQRTNCR